MKSIIGSPWHPILTDPSDSRGAKPRVSGLTMVIDKGLGPNAFYDLLATSADYVDLIKFGFGTSSLYPAPLLREKIAQAKKAGIAAFPGGTLLEAAFRHDVVSDFFGSVMGLGFDGVELSDGTIPLTRAQRDELIREARSLGLRVFTEYGKKRAVPASTSTIFAGRRNAICGWGRSLSRLRRGNPETAWDCSTIAANAARKNFGCC